jgi:hypothetical protein
MRSDITLAEHCASEHQSLLNDRKTGERRPVHMDSMQPKKSTVAAKDQKTSYSEILQTIPNYSDFLDIYRHKVVTQKTRTIRLLGRKSSAKIIHTLLGFEVQASYKRIQCPDMVTARYIRLFSELGCHSIKLPYDPTFTDLIIPEFERMLEIVNARIKELFPANLYTQRHVTRKIFAIIRRQLRNS